MTPLPWSWSAYNDFVTCPRQFEAKRVLKTVQDVKGEEALWGDWVHKQFELRQRDGIVLPDELIQFEPYMAELAKLPGRHFAEQRLALDKNLKPCDFFAKNVWNRAIIDKMIIDGSHAYIKDYKTGKVKKGSLQLALFALFVFHTYPEVRTCHVGYYWTQTMHETREDFLREDIAKLWALFLPNLHQYKEAFLRNIWQPRQSGLCKKHCAVTECEFNGAGRW